ncbi:hypothetical protein Gotri_001136 [Gossypium trilobum]|uniref:Uncharacterized protein n=1 Tax=Gossypium trilobum TaxID=34281 RepID=A0A7J9FDL6_9ROSI|nr:hypothetical protein [Gossypium trilobum]
MINVGLFIQDSNEVSKGMRSYCEFHTKEGEDVCASEEESTEKVYKVNNPVVIISRPRNNEAGPQAALSVIIQKHVAFPYKDNKRVPWNYDCNVMIPREENSVDTLEEGQDIGFYTRSGRCYNSTRTDPTKEKTLAVEQKKEKTARLGSPVNEPVTENEAIPKIHEA